MSFQQFALRKSIMLLRSNNTMTMKNVMPQSLSSMVSSSSMSLQYYQPQQLNNNNKIRTMTVLSKQSGEEYKKMNYSSRMKETGRPVSPHVTIYAFPIAALSSITNRVTGIAMAVGCFGLGSIEIIGGSGTALQCIQFIGSSHYMIAASAKFAVVFPIAYHYICGLRHLRWDNQPDLLTNAQVATSSYYLFGTATVIAAGAALM